MPLVNYCRKCKTETPLSESCPHCGAKLTKTGEQISFGITRKPLCDWFAWNRVLRVGLPALGLVFAAAVTVEAASGGEAAVAALLTRGFTRLTLCMLAGLALATLLLLWLQGDEKVHYVLDKEGVKAFTYLQEPAEAQLLARALSRAGVEALEGDPHALPNLTLVRRVTLPWSELRKVRVWREGGAILFFRPACWQVLAMRCPFQELPEAERYVRAKLKRVKKARVYPMEKAGKH